MEPVLVNSVSHEHGGFFGEQGLPPPEGLEPAQLEAWHRDSCFLNQLLDNTKVRRLNVLSIVCYSWAHLVPRGSWPCLVPRLLELRDSPTPGPAWYPGYCHRLFPRLLRTVGSPTPGPAWYHTRHKTDTYIAWCPSTRGRGFS